MPHSSALPCPRCVLCIFCRWFFCLPLHLLLLVRIAFTDVHAVGCSGSRRQRKGDLRRPVLRHLGHQPPALQGGEPSSVRSRESSVLCVRVAYQGARVWLRVAAVLRDGQNYNPNPTPSRPNQSIGWHYQKYILSHTQCVPSIFWDASGARLLFISVHVILFQLATRPSCRIIPLPHE